MKVLLIRHAQSEANAMNIPQGQRVDTYLSKKGKGQAERLSERLKEEKIEVIYASDLKRAKETAEIINKHHNLEIRLDRRLREFDLGDFTGLRNKWETFQAYKVLMAKEKGIRPCEVEPPNGESELAHHLRVKSFMEDVLRGAHKTVAIVAHAGTNRIFFATANYVSKSEMYGLLQHNCCLNELEYLGSWKVHKLNCTLHLNEIT